MVLAMACHCPENSAPKALICGCNTAVQHVQSKCGRQIVAAQRCTQGHGRPKRTPVGDGTGVPRGHAGCGFCCRVRNVTTWPE